MISDINYLLGGMRPTLPGARILLGKLGSLLHLKLGSEICQTSRVCERGLYFSVEKVLAKLQQYITDFPEVEEKAVVQAMKPEWTHAISARLAVSLHSGGTRPRY